MSQSPAISLDVSVAMGTDTGRKRKQNQDAIGHLTPTDPEVLARLGQIFVLADGVGGLTGGDLASQYAVSTIISSYFEQEEGEPGERLARAIAEANNVIFAEGQGADKPHIMATTVVVAVIRGRELTVGSVGDSPAYLMRDANPRKLTLDHNLETMSRVAGVPIAEGDPAGRKLVRALGSMPSVKVDIISGMVRSGDHIVLCSDGLTRYLEPADIERTVATSSPQRAVKALIDKANEMGGGDNISVIVLRLHEEESTRPAAPPIPPLDDFQSVTEGYTILHQPAKTPPVQQERPAVPNNALAELWHLLRGNAILTMIGMGVLLMLFVTIMLIVVNMGGNKGLTRDKATATITATSGPSPAQLTATAGTAQAAMMATKDAFDLTEAANAAAAALLTLSPAPPSGPQMEKGTWFRLQEGDPVPAFESPDVNGVSSDPLEAGTNYLVDDVNSEARNGPWYHVINNQGNEPFRWVNGPSLHQRVLAIDVSGNALPPDQQPEDISPSVATPTRAPIATATPTATLIPGTPTITPPFQPTATLYPVEAWVLGVTTVYMQTDFQLRADASLQGVETDAVALGESALIISGPIASDGHWWWQVRFTDGRVGWVAQPLLSFGPVQ